MDENDTLQKFVNVIKQGFVGLFFIGVVVYTVLLGLYALGSAPSAIAAMFARNPTYTVGLPICGGTAFAIVCVLERLSPPAPNSKTGKLEFKAFSLTFSGPAGPATLWIVCYLVLVASMKMVVGL